MSKVARICDGCGVEFMARAWSVSRGGGRFCSRACAGRAAGTVTQARRRATGIKNYFTPETARLHQEKAQSARKAAMDAIPYPRVSNTRVGREAYAAVKRALRSGDIKRKPCEACGNAKAEAHHEDYSKPLDVQWLCRRCHFRHHAGKAS
jgi:ribosomal protein S27AE